MNRRERVKITKKIKLIIEDFEYMDSMEDLPPIAGEALSLLRFDPELYENFNSAFDARLNSDEYHYNRCLGDMKAYLHQGLCSLENNLAVNMNTRNKSNQTEISSEKITISWLLKHVPVRFWFISAGLILGSFLFGVSMGSSLIYQQYILPIAKAAAEATPFGTENSVLLDISLEENIGNKPTPSITENNDLKQENEVIEKSNRLLSAEEVAKQIKILDEKKQNLLSRRSELVAQASPGIKTDGEISTPDIEDIDFQIDLINEQIQELSLSN